MYFIYDNLTATLVGGTVILVLMAMQMNIVQMNVQQTVTYMTKKYSLDFADWLEDDLLAIGENLDPDDPKCDANPNAWGCWIIKNPDVEDGLTMRFVFAFDSVRYDRGTHMTDTLHVIVKYELEEVSEPGEEDLYQAVRYAKMWRPWEMKPATFTRTGSSAGLLKQFTIEMRDRNGERVDDPAQHMEDIEQTYARFAMVPPFQSEDRDLRAMYWGASLLLRE